MQNIEENYKKNIEVFKVVTFSYRNVLL